MAKIEDLKLNEAITIKGGSWVKFTPVGVAIWFSNEVINNWSDIKSGIKDGFNDAVTFLDSFGEEN